MGPVTGSRVSVQHLLRPPSIRGWRIHLVVAVIQGQGDGLDVGTTVEVVLEVDFNLLRRCCYLSWKAWDARRLIELFMLLPASILVCMVSVLA